MTCRWRNKCKSLNVFTIIALLLVAVGCATVPSATDVDPENSAIIVARVTGRQMAAEDDLYSFNPSAKGWKLKTLDVFNKTQEKRWIPSFSKEGYFIMYVPPGDYAVRTKLDVKTAKRRGKKYEVIKDFYAPAGKVVNLGTFKVMKTKPHEVVGGYANQIRIRTMYDIAHGESDWDYENPFQWYEKQQPELFARYQGKYYAPFPLSPDNRPDYVPGNARDNLKEILGVVPGVTKDDLLRKYSMKGIDVRELDWEGEKALVMNRPLADIEDAMLAVYRFHGKRVANCRVFLDVQESDPSADPIMDYMYILGTSLTKRLGNSFRAGKQKFRNEKRLQGIIDGDNLYINVWEYDEYRILLYLSGKEVAGELPASLMGDRKVFLFLEFNHIPTMMEKTVSGG